MEVNGAGGKLDCTPLWTGWRGGAKLQVYYANTFIAAAAVTHNYNFYFGAIHKHSS